MFQRLEQRMAERQTMYERRLEQYSQTLHDMRNQVKTLELQVLEMLQLQFSRLAKAIREMLQLPQYQADILQDLVDDHLHRLAVTTQLRLPQGPYQLMQQDQLDSITPAPQTIQPTRHHNRDPRQTSSQYQMEG